MGSSLLDLINNLTEGIHKIKCKNEHDNKNCEMRGYKACKCFLKYTNFKDDLIEYKCLFCNYQKKLNENLKK